MKAHIRIFFSIIYVIWCGCGFAQNLSSAYFLDGFAYGHELNPAQDYTHKGYFSIPILPGNVNIGIRGNLCLKDLVYKNEANGGLVTFLHPSIDASTALEKFHKNNKFQSDIRYDFLSAGFHAFSGYNTIALAMRANLNTHIPYNLFDLSKRLQNKDYDISGMEAFAASWIELALGHSRQWSDALRIGGKFKLLLGLGYASIKMNNLTLSLEDKNKWMASAHAEAEVGLKNFSWGQMDTKEYNNPERGTYQQIDFNNVDIDGIGITGAGMAVDMGLEWDLDRQDIIDGVTLSASLLDLGFIRWNHVSMARNKGEDFVFDGFNEIKVEDGNGTKFDKQLDDVGDRFTNLYSLQAAGTTGKAHSLGATLCMGMEYVWPSYDKVSLGFLSTIRMQGRYGWNEERLCSSLELCKWFNLSANVCFGTYGSTLGWVLNVHPRGFNLFLGSDHCVGKFSKQGIPLSSNYHVSMGVNIPLGISL